MTKQNQDTSGAKERHYRKSGYLGGSDNRGAYGQRQDISGRYPNTRFGGKLHKFGSRLLQVITELLNVGLAENISVRLQISWPLLLLPIALINQLLAPHPVWLVLFIVISGIYCIAIGWIRYQVHGVELVRQRVSETVAAGEPLIEQFRLINEGILPVLWAAIDDYSTLPEYNPGRVVACRPDSSYKWQTDALCGQRGLFRLGPSVVRWADPFGLLSAQKQFPDFEKIVIYPRIAKLPDFQLLYGSVGGARQLQHPLIGSIRSASVRQYQPGDTLRNVHWPSTARNRNMMVTELDAEHGGEVWLVLDLNNQVHQGEGLEGTLEYSIIVVASLAAQLLNSNERLAVGLLIGFDTASVVEAPTTPELINPELINPELVNPELVNPEPSTMDSADAEHLSLNGLQAIAPQAGQAQLWQIMGALAMAQTVSLPLSQLLQSSRSMVSGRQSLIVVTPEMGADNREDGSDVGVDEPSAARDIGTLDGSASDDWLDELAQSRHRGRSNVILVQHVEPAPDIGERGDDETDAELTGDQGNNQGNEQASTGDQSAGEINGDETINAALQRQELLSRQEIGCTIMRTNETLEPLIPRKRTRREIRSTPMGGAYTVEVEEEVL